jgi:glutamate dehydrogenase
MNETPSPKLPAPVVDAVTQLLRATDLQSLSALGHNLNGHTPFSVATFLSQLFARAPESLIRSHSATEMAGIIRGCVNAVLNLPTQPDRISLDSIQTETSTAIFLALRDQSFIISSISEALSDADIKVTAFLHPIVHAHGEPIAVSYIEVDPSCAENVPALLPRLREMLVTLVQVGLDFTPMQTLATSTANALSSSLSRSNFGAVQASEVSQFLHWLVDGCFFFIGAGRFSNTLAREAVDTLGVWRSHGAYIDTLTAEIREDLDALQRDNLDISIRKLRTVSHVHRRATLVHVLIRLNEESISFVGYLTSKAWAHESDEIPVLRKKVASVVTQEGVTPHSHDFKYMVEVIDNMPTDEALAAPATELATLTRLALEVFSQEETRSLTTVDALHRRAFTTIIMPPERYSAAAQAEIQKILEETFAATPYSSDTHLDSSKKRQFRLYISTPLPKSSEELRIPAYLSELIVHATLPWEEKLRILALALNEDLSPHGVFSSDYQAGTEVDEALRDLTTLATLSPSNPVAVSLHGASAKNALSTISLFSREREISISLATPVLENIGLEVLSAHSYECREGNTLTYLLKLCVRAYDGESLLPGPFNDSVSPGLAKILRGDAPNDPLNLLLRKAHLSIQQIGLLRSYCALLWQVSKISTKRTMWEALAGAPHVAQQLCRIFDWKFNPALNLSMPERIQRALLEESVLIEALRQVPDITQDRILRSMLSLLKSSVRTNFFAGRETLAIKLRSQEIEIMPHPRPLFEIFVFSSRIEGTHLRSARVARGGIRWSERIDDYRSEVLGLMKTQKVKNVIIVPSGAKGGFVVKNLPRQSDAVGKAVEDGYREYITALLTLADTKRGETVIHPPQCVIHDDSDPYFVVAADKGTATFSDVANSIAINDFNFWLGDAFASGGSAGYDHKKHGITARGGWECVTRHFKDLGIRFEESPFTVVGLGDMSGDVFGNGLMLSRNMALIAAFNHKHILIDPKPDVTKAYEERVRLFTLPRSQWSDFNPSLISKGGGVFNRYDKEISVTPEIREALTIPSDAPATMDGETLITHILRAQVDLLWNGGIGTYVKARSEAHSDVNDGTNDRVRINADELRARVVGEGGNLGFTQKARIEFALRGGRINTDAIDNSGGVDLSDHEVNLKLLLSPMVDAGRLSGNARNELLQAIAPEVVSSVLHHNRDQALMLSISRIRSLSTVEQYRHLIRDMHRMGYMDRNRDNLPDETDLDERALEKVGLTRPELALCSAAVKMWAKDEIRTSNLCSDKNLERYLINYFPGRIQREFPSEVLKHPLRNDIIASEMVGEILPVVGISFLHSMTSMNGTPVATAMKCLLAADSILGGAALREHIRALDSSTNSESFTQLWLDMGTAIREASNWLLTTHGGSLPLDEIVKLYAPTFETLTTHGALVFTGQEFVRFERRVSEYTRLGASERDSIVLALYRRTLPLLEMLWSAREFKSDVRLVASTYSQILEEFRVNELFKFENLLETSSKWEHDLIVGAYQEIRRNISLITGQIVKRGLTDSKDIQAALKSGSGYDAIRSTMTDLEELVRQKRPFQIAALPVISRQLRLFSIKSAS